MIWSPTLISFLTLSVIFFLSPFCSSRTIFSVPQTQWAPSYFRQSLSLAISTSGMFYPKIPSVLAPFYFCLNVTFCFFHHSPSQNFFSCLLLYHFIWHLTKIWHIYFFLFVVCLLQPELKFCTRAQILFVLFLDHWLLPRTVPGIL